MKAILDLSFLPLASSFLIFSSRSAAFFSALLTFQAAKVSGVTGVSSSNFNSERSFSIFSSKVNSSSSDSSPFFLSRDS